MPWQGRPTVLPSTGPLTSGPTSPSPVAAGQGGDLLGLLTAVHRQRSQRSLNRSNGFLAEEPVHHDSGGGEDSTDRQPGISEQLLAERRAYKAAAAAAVGKLHAQGSKRRLVGAGETSSSLRNVKARLLAEQEAAVMPQGLLSRVRSEAQEQVNKAQEDNRHQDKGGKQHVVVLGCPVDAKGQLLEAACRSRGRCVGCMGCRAKVKLSRLLDATDVELVKTEHCTCVDRVTVRTEVLKNYESLQARKRSAPFAPPAEAANAVPNNGGAGAIHIQRVHDGVTEEVKGVVAADPAHRHQTPPTGLAHRNQSNGSGPGTNGNSANSSSKPLPTQNSQPAAPEDVAVPEEVISSMTAGLKKKKANKQKPDKSKTVGAVVLKERINIQSVYCYVTMRQLDDTLQVEAVDSATGELYIAKTRLLRSYMEKKSNQTRDEMYRQILTQMLAFKKDADDETPASRGNQVAGGPRYMQKEEKKKRLAIIINTPSAHHHDSRRRRPRLPPFLSELMTLDGSVFLVKAHLESAELLLIFSHQTYSLETFLAVPLAAFPLFKGKTIEAKDKRQLRANVLKVLIASFSAPQQPQSSLDETNLPQLVRRLCQGISFKRVEANLHFYLQPILRVELQDILNEVVLIQRSCGTIQRIYRGHRGRRRAAAWKEQATKAAIRLQSRMRGILLRRSFRKTVRRIVAVRRIRQVHKLNKEPFAVRMQCFMRLLRAKKKLKGLVEARRARDRAEAEAREQEARRLREEAIERERVAREERERQEALQRQREAEELARRNKAATRIQTAARGRLARKELERRRREEEARQRRRKQEAEEARRRQQEKERRATTAIQTAFRSHLAREELTRRKAERHRQLEEQRRKARAELEERSAIIIQKAARGRAARIELKKRKAKKAAELERLAREESARKKREEEEAAIKKRQEDERRAAIAIQTTFRGHRARGELKRRKAKRAAELERQAREEAARRKKHEDERKAATAIQTSFRGHLARKELKRRKAERAAELERRAREAAAARKRREEQERKARMELEQRSAIIIQKAARGRAARLELKKRKARKAAELERQAREEAAQRKQEEEEAARKKRQKDEQKAALTIQTAFRRHRAQAELKRRRGVRAAELERLAKEESARKRREEHGAIKIQSAFRGHAARAEVKRRKAEQAAELERRAKEEKGAIAIQAASRGRLARSDLERRKEAARQEAARKKREEQLAKEEEARRKTKEEQEAIGAIALQKAARGRAARVEVGRLKADKTAQQKAEAAKQEAKRVRKHKAAVRVRATVRALVLLKRLARRGRERAEQKRRRHKASAGGIVTTVLMVQKMWRGRQARVYMAQWKAWWEYQGVCATKIQRVWRGHYVRAVVKPWRVYEVEQVQVQEQWRHWEVQQKAVTKLQAVARGKAARKRYQRMWADHLKQQQPQESPEAFIWARDGDYNNLVAALESNSLDANLREAATGQTLLMAALQAREKYIMEWLIYYGADTNAQDDDGNTALHLAKQLGFDEIADYLLETVQVDGTIKNHEGHTYMYYDL